MNTTSDHDLSLRLDRLERENRRIKRGATAACAGLGLLSLMSFAAPLCKTIWAERFVLQDASDRARVTLNAYGTDQPGITFHDGRGQAVTSFTLASDGSLTVHVVEEGKAVPARVRVTEEGALTFTAHRDTACKLEGSAGKPTGSSTGVN